MSKSIYEDRIGYYNALDKTTGRFQKDEPLDITYWMECFFKTLHDALLDAQKQLSYIVDLLIKQSFGMLIGVMN
jgi:hypothetical protein